MSFFIFYRNSLTQPNRVAVEAASADEANEKAVQLGLVFGPGDDGCVHCGGEWGQLVSGAPGVPTAPEGVPVITFEA